MTLVDSIKTLSTSWLVTSRSSSRDPGQSTETRPLEYPAHHGASSTQHHETDTPILQKLWSPDTTLQVKANANNGVGMEDGLQAKAIQQQENVAERSRLRKEGLFEEHMTHDGMTNLSQEHRAVADGSRVEL
ncbi:BQ2448_4912 [Microbotryum intermedium]|uniref:BQ2448_4912 protein n=1 Tax=Microbotryum intermedium TaxID=269621 RepID=A0A238FM00_9BASI|nr:BQ2448_4912 [Microbotryum intermedium]